MRAEYSGDRHERSREWKLGDGAPPDPDTPEQLQVYLEDVALRRSMRREAVTDEKGEFTLAGLLDDRYSLHAYLKGWSFDPDQPDLRWSARPGVIADFTGKRVVLLPIDVRLSDGTQPKRAQINITVHNDSRAERWAPERSELRLGAGSYSMSATAGDHEEWRSEAQNVVLKEGATPSQITFRLNARTGIHGRIVVPKGYAIDSVSVFALRYAGTAVPEESALRNGQNNWASAWNGYEFNFFDLAAGNYLIGAGTWETIFSSKSVEVAAGAITEMTLEITDSGATGLVVKVVAPDGAPVADAQVRVFAAGAQWDSPEGFSVRPKKDGAWVVVPKKDAPSDLKDWFVQAYSERYGEKAVAMPSGAAGELKIDMLEPASLDVTITGYAGTNLEGRLRVEAKPLSTKESQKRVYYSRGDHPVGPDGKVTLKPLQPGRYRVDILYSQERWAGSSLDHQDVEIAPGANAVTIAAPAVYSLSVVVAGEADAQLNMQMIGGSGEERWSRAKVGPDGTATFEGLIAGTYRLMLYGGKGRRQRSMKVTVPAAGAVTFKEDVETALVVRALDSDGYLASAGFQAGDVITGADGTDFDGSRPASQVLSGLLSARKDLTLRFVHSGKSSEASVDSEKFLAATNHLRALEPGGK